MILGGDPDELERIGIPRGKPEELIQRAVVQHLRARSVPNLLWWHTPNGGKRHVAEARKFKSLGVRPGVSDIVALHNGEFFALELKADGGRPTDLQLKFISDVHAAGGFGCVAEGENEALMVLESWGLLRGTAR